MEKALRKQSLFLLRYIRFRLVLIIPEASAMMEIVAFGFSGGLLGIEVEESGLPAPISKENKAFMQRFRRNSHWDHGFSAVFFAPSIAEPGTPKRAWTPADCRLMPTLSPKVPTISVRASLALQAMRQFWWLGEGTEAVARMLLETDSV